MIFCGRQKEVQKILSNILAGKNIYVHGPNNIGKTWLMEHISNQEIMQEYTNEKLAITYVKNVEVGRNTICKKILSSNTFPDEIKVKDTFKFTIKKAYEEYKALIKNNGDEVTNAELMTLVEELYGEAYKEGIKHVVLIVEEFQSINGFSEIKRNDIISFFSNLKSSLEDKKLTLTLILTSRSKLEMILEADHFKGFRNSFSSDKGENIGISGFIDTDLPFVYRAMPALNKVVPNMRQNIMKEVFYICGRHPGLLSKVEEYFDKEEIITIESAQNSVIKAKKIFSDFYDLLKTERMVQSFIGIFDRESVLSGKEKKEILEQLEGRGFITKTESGISEAVKKEELHTWFGEITESDKERLEVICDGYEPISPYMYTYVKEEYEKEIKEEAEQEVAATAQLPATQEKASIADELGNTKYELGFERGYNQGLKDGITGGVNACKEILKENNSKEIEIQKLNNALEVAKTEIEAKKQVELKELEIKREIHLAEITNSRIAETIKAATKDKSKEIDELKRKIADLLEKSSSGELSKEEAEKYKAEIAKLQNALSETQAELEETKKNVAAELEEAFLNSLKEKHRQIFESVITEESLNRVLSTTWYTCPLTFNGLEKSIEYITSAGLLGDLQLAVFLHELFNDTKAFIAWDYTLVTMLYSRLYEALLKKYHLQFYKEKVGDVPVRSGGPDVASARENEVPIGLFTTAMNTPVKLADLKSINAGESIMSVADWDAHWNKHKNVANLIREIRNGVMHPGEPDISNWHTNTQNEYTNAKSQAVQPDPIPGQDSALTPADPARDMLKILLYEMFCNKGIEEVAVIGEAYMKYKELSKPVHERIQDADSVTFVFKERKQKAGKGFRWLGEIIWDGVAYKASMPYDEAPQSENPAEGTAYEVKVYNYQPNLNPPIYNVRLLS